MSVTTTASTRLSLRLRSNRVRGRDVVLNPRRITTSLSSSSTRRGLISIGSQGETSRPCSQAAVLPEKAANVGSRSLAASSLMTGVSRSAADAYTPGARRRQLAPSRCQRERPARRASATVNGPRVSSFGLTGRIATDRASSLTRGVATDPIKKFRTASADLCGYPVCPDSRIRWWMRAMSPSRVPTRRLRSSPGPSFAS